MSDFGALGEQAPFHVMVSELLGSFGDNELSPDILLEIEDVLLDSQVGIAIPSSYTSYLAPVCAQKVWNKARFLPALTFNNNPRTEDAMLSSICQNLSLERGYVTFLNNCHMPCAEQAVFHFDHTTRGSEGDEKGLVGLHTQLSFRYLKPEEEEEEEGEEGDLPAFLQIHGFAAFFSSVLYKDVTISIAPHSRTEDMWSWFPLFIPVCSLILILSHFLSHLSFSYSLSRSKHPSSCPSLLLTPPSRSRLTSGAWATARA